jgi:hypothetical protein
VRAGVDEDARSTSSDASGANDGWLDSLWRKTQKDAEDTIKFIEEEHKKNVQKFEAAIEDIKKTAEEAVDTVQSQFEGRKSLKTLREERVSATRKRRIISKTTPPSLTDTPFSPRTTSRMPR